MNDRSSGAAHRRRAGPPRLVVVVVLGLCLVALGCGKDRKAAPTPGSIADGATASLPDPMLQTPSPAGAEVTVASSTLDVGSPTTFSGTACPPGNRGNLAILPASGPQTEDHLVYVGGADVDGDGHWSFTAEVPHLDDGAAWAVANCADVNTGTIIYTYPRVPLTIRG